ncbi:unnamed protein product [Blepharisma stoltei]|uniref:Uncharacterized protein n=1 Tax=Blepharisma stoltei TaxID=1481888 RepID=A0AAU9ITM5_9CILI|nr:unnamed protein product [Blepharisma stoltei]
MVTAFQSRKFTSSLSSSNDASLEKSCHLCSKPLEKAKTKICASCSKPTCKYHSRINRSGLIVCYNCMYEEIKTNLIIEKNKQIAIYNTDLIDIAKQRKELKHDIKEKTSKIQKLEKQLQNIEKPFENKCENINRRIESEIKYNESIQNELTQLETVFRDAERTKNAMKNKLLETEGEIEILNKNRMNLECGKDMLLNRLNVLMAETKELVPYIKLREFLCGKCKRAIKRRFSEYIIGSIGQDQSRSIFESVINYQKSVLVGYNSRKIKDEPSESCNCDIM